MFGLCKSGCLGNSFNTLFFVFVFRSDCIALETMQVFRTLILFSSVGRFDSALRLQSLVHIGAPSMSLMALF